MPCRILVTAFACLIVGGCANGELELGSNDGGSTGLSGFALADGGGEGAHGGGFVDPLDCASDCEGAAANGCGVDLDTADTECLHLCANSPTASQLDCLEASPCFALESALSGSTTLCGITGREDGGCPPVPQPGGGGSSEDPTDCALDCEGAAANGCGVDLDTADTECMNLCAKSPTENQVDCLGAAPCCALVSALAAGGGICGI